MTGRRRHAAWVAPAVLLVVLLGGGRWVAIETAERAWAATIAGGETYVAGRALAVLFRVIVLLLTAAWATGNLYLVYRAIGAVQLPRRLGDLEIVETVSREVLLAGTLISGLLFGLVLTWGTGDWWLAAVLASQRPQFGVADPVLGRDLGHYVATLPWTAQLQDHVLAAVASATVVVVLLYVGIGMIGWRDGAPMVRPRARLHLAVLLACLGVAFAWGAALDPSEVVGGLHGPSDPAGVAARIGGAAPLVAIAMLTALASLLWGWTGRWAIVAVTWAVFVAGAPFVYLILPAAAASARTSAADTSGMADLRRTFTERAFGVRLLGAGLPPWPDAAAAIAESPLWDEARVVHALRRAASFGPRSTLGAVRLEASVPPRWLAGPAPDEVALRDAVPAPDWSEIHTGEWSASGGAIAAVETDTGLTFAPVHLRDPTALYGPGFAQYAVRQAAAGKRRGIPLEGWWRRAALAWTLQAPELAGGAVEGHVLLWRRDVSDRLDRLAPFATFEPPRPVVADSALWWIAWGYLDARAFPVARAVRWGGRRVRYLQAGVVGAVAAADGETRLFLAPGHDSLAAAWGRAFAPLVAPADSLPPALRRALPPPADAFAAALDALAADAGDTGWVRRPATSVQLVAPSPDGTTRLAVWRVQVFEAGAPPQLVALFGGAMTGAGPAYAWWRPAAPVRAPPPVLGTGDTRPGPLRIWPVEGSALGIQGLFREPPRGSTALPAVARVYVTRGEEVGEGSSRADAWADLLATARRPTGGEPDAGGRWDRARALLARADSALRAGDLERFGRSYEELKRLLGVAPPALAPSRRPQ